MGHPLAVSNVRPHAFKRSQDLPQTLRYRLDLGEELIEVWESPWDVAVYKVAVLVGVLHTRLDAERERLKYLK